MEWDPCRGLSGLNWWGGRRARLRAIGVWSCVKVRRDGDAADLEIFGISTGRYIKALDMWNFQRDSIMGLLLSAHHYHKTQPGSVQPKLKTPFSPPPSQAKNLSSTIGPVKAVQDVLHPTANRHS